MLVVSVGHRSQVQHALISCCNNALWVGRMVSITLLFLEENLSGCLTDNVPVTGLVIQDDCGAFKYFNKELIQLSVWAGVERWGGGGGLPSA